MKRFWIVVVTLGAMAATVYWGAPLWVEHEIERRMRAELPPSVITCDEVDWSWDNSVEITDLRLESNGVGVVFDAIRADVQVLDLWKRHVAVSFDGQARIEAPPAVRVARTWELKGQLSTATGRGTFRLEPAGATPSPRSPSQSPGDGVESRRWTVKATGIRGDLRLPVGGSAWGLDATIRDGQLFVVGAPGSAKVRASDVTLSAGAGQAPFIATDRFSVDVRRTEPEFDDLLPEADAQPVSERADGGASRRARLQDLLTSIDDVRIRATGGELSLQHAGSTLLVKNLSVGKTRRSLAASADVFDGTVTIEAEVSPAGAWPTRATVSATGVELHELPAGWFPTRSVAGEMSAEAVGVYTPMPGATRPAASGAFRVSLADVSVASAGLIRGTIATSDLKLAADWSWEPSLRRARVSDGELRYGDLPLDISGGWRDTPGGPVVDASVAADRTECQVFVDSVPPQLFGSYRHAEIKGAAGPRFSVEYPLDDPERLNIELEGFPGDCRVEALRAAPRAWPAIQSVSSPDDVKWLNTPFVLPVDEGVTDDANVEVGPGLETYVPLEEMPDYVGGAAYLSEEVNFYDDGAWNVHLIQRALRMNLSDGRFVYGGSTVTQQLVKNLFLTRDKTIARKIREALIAWRIQDVVSKERVLELYLNCIEYGEDLYGIGPAARRYFNRPASELTVLQAVFLATIKPAPWYGDQFYERGQTPKRGWWPERIEEITRRLHKHDYISQAQLEAAKPFVVTFPTEASVDVDTE